jgi:hypothetical protein
VDKFAEGLKATVAVFHGIIATWLFLDFSERKVSEFYFLILLVFFSVANVLVWNAVLGIARRRRTGSGSISVGIERVAFRATDVVGLTIIAITIGLLAAFLDRQDVVLRAANAIHIADWHRTGSGNPFDAMMFDVTDQTTRAFDNRSSRLVAAAKEKDSYLRIIPKDGRLGYEGFPGRGTTKGDVAEREVLLTPACRISYDKVDPAKILSIQRIEGPGVFLHLADTTIVEIIDVYQSECEKLLNAAE